MSFIPFAPQENLSVMYAKILGSLQLHVSSEIKETVSVVDEAIYDQWGVVIEVLIARYIARRI